MTLRVLCADLGSPAEERHGTGGSPGMSHMATKGTWRGAESTVSVQAGKEQLPEDNI